MHKIVMLFVSILILLFGCQNHKLPSVAHSQYAYYKSYKIENGELRINLQNPLHCPLRVWIQSSENEMQFEFDKVNPVVVKALKDTLLSFAVAKNINYNISFASRLGDTLQKIENTKLELPFPKKRMYSVVQGNNTNFTHNNSRSRYAVDFNLKVNDTACAATSGFVVGVVDEYRLGGSSSEWEPYSNFITIYDPVSGLFTQYVHLVYKGSLVKLGDKVEGGQPIALSGKTGQTNIEHLHFNCLIPTHNNDGLKSVPFEFIGGYESQRLKKGDKLKK